MQLHVAVRFLSLILIVLLAACGNKDVCATGSTDVSGRCVATDGGADGGQSHGAVDGSQPDAGPCGGACSGDTPVCDETSGTCVGCLSNGDCAAPTPACDTSSHTCVACTADADCTDPTMPACDSGTETCTTCTDASQCTHLAGTGVCDSSSGACVECSCADTSACSSGICDGDTDTCMTGTGTTGLCQACTTDADCRPGQLCEPMSFGSPAMSVGTFCLWQQSACGTGAPNGDCTTTRPYVEALAGATSVDGTTATVCGLAVTTCPALNDFRMQACSGLGDDSVCGATGFNDGFCAMYGATTYRCTVPCGSDDDCPDPPGPAMFTCNTTSGMCNLM